jgi:Ca2+-transporting ATPase
MGSRATEVARAAAGLVLLNDDFGALMATISDGRRLFFNIQKAFRYLIGFKVMLVAMAFGAPLFDMPILLTPLNVVWLELIVHTVSALVFEGRDSGEDVMGRPPLGPSRSIGRCTTLLNLWRASRYRSSRSVCLLPPGWRAIRAKRGDGNGGHWKRSVNFR